MLYAYDYEVPGRARGRLLMDSPHLFHAFDHLEWFYCTTNIDVEPVNVSTDPGSDSTTEGRGQNALRDMDAGHGVSPPDYDV